MTETMAYFISLLDAYSLPFMKLEWTGEGVKRGRDKHLTLNHYDTYMTWDSMDTKPQRTGAEHSTLRILFRFDHLVSNFVVTTIGPTILILGVAYSSFWIHVESGPGRFLLTVLTLLSIVTQFASVRSTSMPLVSYVSAADVWFLVCMVFIFVAIMELAVVNYLDKRRKIQIAARAKKSDLNSPTPVTVSQIRSMKDKMTPSRILNAFSNSGNGNGPHVTLGSWSPSSPVDQEFDRMRTSSVQLTPAPITNRMPYEEIMRLPNTEPKDYAARIDVIMRIAYPLFFLLFNIIYWPFLYSLRSDSFSPQYT